jgi:cytochrome P450
MLPLGHDTTSSLLTWTFYELCQHPKIMQRCREEVDQVLASADATATDRSTKHVYINYEMVNQMEYLTCVLKEVLRLHTPAVGLGRRGLVSLDIPDLNSVDQILHTMPAGTIYFVSLYSLHRQASSRSFPVLFRETLPWLLVGIQISGRIPILSNQSDL